jgi:hypothetical protein
MRQGLCLQDLAYRFNIALSTTSGIVSTWVQFMYQNFSMLKEKMFLTKEMIRQIAPISFKKLGNLRVIVDCTEIFIESPRNFHEQGNVYSNYKNHATIKVLIGVAPNGMITFVSEAYEGAISDNEIFRKSGIMAMLHPGDMVMADRGFTVREDLQRIKVDLNIPPFLSGRKHLTPQEEVKTKQIARLRIHVERSIERMKNWKIFQGVMPSSLKPMASQLVFVACCLVNYQSPVVPR